MDIRMPEHGRHRGHRGHRRPDGRRRGSLILTTFDLDEYVYAALRAGASGFLLKDGGPSSWSTPSASSRPGDALLAPAVTRRLIEDFARRPQPERGRPTLARADARESEVLGLIASRAARTRRSPPSCSSREATVKTHVRRILKKLGLRDRMQAVVLAYESGLVEPREGAGEEPLRSS